jgi:hypothetical protein
MLEPCDKAWITIGAFVLAYDLLAPEGPTLSEGADKYMLHHRWLTRAVGISLVAHVCNMIAPRFDAIHGLFLLGRRWRRPTP